MKIVNIFPNNFLVGQSKQITLTGNGFSSPVNVIINNVSIPCFFVTSNMVKFLVHSLPQGSYDVFIRNGDNSVTCLKNGINITNRTDNLTLGSALNPIVLPVKYIDTKQNSLVNSASLNELYETTASTSFNTENSTIVGNKKISIDSESKQVIVSSQPQDLNTNYGDVNS